MKTAIKPKNFDLKSALYSLRRVYWHNVFVIQERKASGWDDWGTQSYCAALTEQNRWILKQIKGIQRQINP